MSTRVPIASWSHTCSTHTRLCAEPETDGGAHFISRGGGCSFGDAAFLTDGNTVQSVKNTDIQINEQGRSCIVDAAVEMGVLHKYLISKGWFFPVFGGTQWATVGGAVASDIHGKNHHLAGSFGCYVKSIKLQVASGEILSCSPEQHSDLFCATLGGMGLTGHILSVELLLETSRYQAVSESKTPFSSFEHMMSLLSAEPEYHYACLYICAEPLNGIYVSATPVEDPVRPISEARDWPWMPSIPIVNNRTLRLANHWLKLKKRPSSKVKHLFDFNYAGPHQRLKQANRLLSKNGVIEFHYQLDEGHFLASLNLLKEMAQKSQIPLTHIVVKRLGTKKSKGTLAFCAPGYAVNFQVQQCANSKPFLRDFARHLTPLFPRYYLAKDACLTAALFAQSDVPLEQWQQQVRKWDPNNKIQSDLSRRLNLKPW